MNGPLYKTADGERMVMDLYEAALRRWPVPHETRIVPTRYGDTFVILSGNNDTPSLVLIHGASSNAAAWMGDVERYSRQFRVITVDVIGEPGKSAPARPSWDSAAYADWLHDVLDALGCKNVSLVGMSQGGWIALKFAIAYPERVRKLILLSPGGITPTKPSFLLAAVALTLMGRWGATRLNRYVFGPVTVGPDVVRFMNAVMIHFIPRFDREYIFGDAELGRLTMPVLLIGGKKDVIRSIGAMEERMRRLCPKVDVVSLPDAGHVLVNLAGEILPFLTRR